MNQLTVYMFNLIDESIQTVFCSRLDEVLVQSSVLHDTKIP